ncbi:MAG: DUF2190 family protein [Sphingomonadales bacterium]|nr:DUF2190 family protein [Sphingomonadales bacterium]
MRNFVQPGHTLDYIAPAGGVVSGNPILIGTVLVIPAATAKEGELFAGTIEGVIALPCATGTAWTPHVALHWDDTNKRVTTTATNNQKIGMAAAAKAAPAASGNVKLLPAV